MTQKKLDLNKKEKSKIKEEFPDLEDLMFRNKEAKKNQAKKDYYKKKKLR